MDIRNIKYSKDAYNYAKDMGKPIPELEDIIAQEPYWSYKYAADVIKDRFEKGENVIAQDPKWNKEYAKEFGLEKF